MLARITITGTLGLTASGCISLAGGSGAHLPVSGPTRVASATFAFGGWYAIRDKFVLDLQMGYELGPLGDKSNTCFMTGGRFQTPSHGWRPGYYGTLLVGFPFPNDQENWEAGPTGSAFRAGAGVAWTTFSDKKDDFGPLAYGSILLGLGYHHQEQSDIGTGDFLGVELTLVLGGNVIEAFGSDTDD